MAGVPWSTSQSAASSNRASATPSCVVAGSASVTQAPAVSGPKSSSAAMSKVNGVTATRRLRAVRPGSWPVIAARNAVSAECG
ncbi:hypothetical protein H480_10065, partial [Amycolatopsis vancoresmycina DSM 44592]